MKILFLGRKKVSAELLKWTIEQGHEIVGVITDSHLSNSPTHKMAKNLNLNVYEINEIYTLIKTGKMPKFDLAVSVLYWKKIKNPLIDFPQFGIINFHPAPLPDYKGTAGYNIAILNNLEKWAITAHYINESIDDGPIIEKIEFDIDKDYETALSLEKKSQTYIKSIYKKVISNVSQKGILETSPNSGGIYISRKQMEAMKEIKEGDDIDRKIRAFWFPPYTGAFIIKNGVKYTLVNQFILDQLAEKGTTNLHSIKRGEKKA